MKRSTIALTIEDFGKTAVDIGRLAENKAVQVRVDLSKILLQEPKATASLVVESPSGDKYPAITRMEGKTLIWDVAAADVASAGNGKVQLNVIGTNGEVLKSAVAATRIGGSIVGDGQAPAPVQNWIDNAAKAVSKANAVADEVQRKLDNGDFVGAKGEKGDPGDVQDVQVAGVSVLTDGVANVPIASETKLGVIMIGNAQNSGIYVAQNGNCYISYATTPELDGRTAQRKTIVCSNLDYAVKAAMCDGKGAAWTAAEQKAAWERMGIDKPYELIEEITLTEGVKQIKRHNFDYAVSSLVGCVELPVVTVPFGMFMKALWDGDSYVTGCKVGIKEAESSIRFELAIHNGIITGQCQGYGKGWGGGIIYGANNAASLKYCDKIKGVTFYAPEADAVIPANAIVRIYGVRA